MTDEKITIEVTGKDQDEALKNAEKAAKQKGYQRVSLKNIVSVTYTVDIFDPIEPRE